MPSTTDLEHLVPVSFVDAFRQRRTIRPAARAAVLTALGPTPGPAAPVAVAPRGARLEMAGELTLEDGTALGRVAEVPVDAPFGYHALVGDDGAAQRLITGPGRCHLPPDLRVWGWSVQLATTRSQRSWGIGDLADLRELAAWSAGAGAGFVTVSPLGAPNPSPDPEPSPYYPSTRRWLNPLHLAVELVPGADRVEGRDRMAAQARALNARPVVDRVAVWALKAGALERAYAAGPPPPEFAAWREERGAPLERWATFVALSERHGADWRRWPEALRRPDGQPVRRAAAEHAARIEYHAWLQWCLDRQLADASAPLPRFADQPVGVDPGGFDAWDWQEQLADGITIGVPPDRFNPDGQDWGMPAFHPFRLREAGHGPFVDTIRAQLRHAGGLRIDHVLGLFRLWWIPAGNHPTDGAYVRQPTDELLEIVALESHRAGAVVVGEDLGTVPPGVRRELRRRRLLSTRLVLFERRSIERWPRQSFAAVTTHDLPTIAGTWSGTDLDDLRAAGVDADPRELARTRARMARAAGLGPEADVRDVTLALHRRLAGAPPMLVAATLEDALGDPRRPNVPGTLRPRRDNWSLALAEPIERLTRDAAVRELARALRRRPA